MNISKTKILYTNDYSIFKTQQGNRDLLCSDIKRVEKKILENNLLCYHPILVSKDYFVIDGQHRLEVAKRNNLDIYFIIMDSDSCLKTTQSINTTGKPWTVKDFLKCYVSLGVESYIEFNNILNKFKFLTISQLIDIAAIRNNKSKSENFKDGTMVLCDLDTINENLNGLNNYINTTLKIAKNTHFQRFIVKLNKRGIKFDHERMVRKIDANTDIVKRIPSDPYIYSDVLGDIYNHKLSMKNKVNFNLRKIK